MDQMNSKSNTRTVCLRSDANKRRSFDRFGDDLTQVLLSYLSVKNKFRYECVSKRWQRVIFKTQKDLNLRDISHKLRDKKGLNFLSTRFGSVLKKCPNLTSIEMIDENYDKVFHQIFKYCGHLKTIETKTKRNSMSKKNVQMVYEKFGSIIITNCDKLSDVFSSDQCLSKGLKRFDFVMTSKDENRFETFVECNKTTLKSIHVFISEDMNERPMKSLFANISKISSLIEMNIQFDVEISGNVIEYLKPIADNCPKVKKIAFYSVFGVKRYKEFFNCFHLFKQLQRLCFYGQCVETITDFHVKSEDLKACPKLTHLSFNFWPNESAINDNFFTDIDKHLPKLQSIELNSISITEETFESLSKLKNIQKISLIDDSDQFSNILTEELMSESVVKVIENCRKINSIYFTDKEFEINLNSEDIYHLKESGLKDSGVEILKHLKTLQ